MDKRTVLLANKYDRRRLNLVKKDASALSAKYGHSDNIFSHIPGIDESESRVLYLFLSPPVDFKNTTSDGRNKPHYLLFIVDVLKRIGLLGQVLHERTSFEDNQQISEDFKKILSLAKICQEHFEDLSKAYPSLWTETFIVYLKEQDAGLENEDIENQISSATAGIISKNSLYISLFEPYIYNATNDDNFFLSNHALICGAIWNAHLLIPEILHAKSSISRELRRLSSALSVKTTALTGYQTYEELIEELQKDDVFSKITYYLLRLYKEPSAPTSSSTMGGNKSKNPRPRIRFIKASDNLITNDLSFDGINIQVVRALTPRLSSETESDLPEDELVEEDYFQQTDEEPTLSLERRNLNSRQAISHIEKANQFIRDGLSKIEFKELIKELKELEVQPKRKNASTLENCAAIIQIAISLCTGKSFSNHYRIRIISDETSLIKKTVNLKKDCSQVYLPLSYKYLTEIGENHGQNYKTDEFICLNLPPTIRGILKKATNTWLEAQNSFENPKGALLEHSVRASNQELKEKLKKLNLDTRLTPEFLQQTIQNTFFKVSNGDFWTVAILSGSPKVIGATQLHYTTLANLKLFEDYQKGINHLFKEVVDIPKKYSPNQFKGYGNPIRPIKALVKKELAYLSMELTNIVHKDPMKLSTRELIKTHNLVMLFVETYSAYFTGIRNVKNPYISPDSLDHDGFRMVADKVIQNGYNTRIIPVLDPINEMIKQFELYIFALMDVFRRKKLAKWSDFFDDNLGPEVKWRSLLSKSKRFPGFFLINTELKEVIGKRPTLKLIPYTRKAALSLYEKSKQVNNPLFLKLPPNANRHFLRSTLLERGVNPEYIDELMGHRHFGTESWNQVALFNQQDYRETIKAEVQKVYADFKIVNPFEVKKF